MTDSRSQFLTAATNCFADRGFYGTSIAAIVEDLPYTKQALLHHFGSKEKLYAEILKGISERLIEQFDEVAGENEQGDARVIEVFIRFYRNSIASPRESQLLMRELLDNTQRADKAQQWYLRPFLETLTELVMQHSSRAFADRTLALTAIYQVLGAISYFAISRTTLESMFGKNRYRQIEAAFEQELSGVISDRLCKTP